MATPLLPTYIVYPAALAAFSVTANVYILGGQIQEVKDDLKDLKNDLKDLKDNLKDVKGDLGGLMKELRGVVKELRGDIKEMKRDLSAVVAHQTALELLRMSVAEKLLKDCGKKG
ncbi:MAG: hypothetical protein Q9171_007276 [Xanthocarpia ochracea]